MWQKEVGRRETRKRGGGEEKGGGKRLFQTLPTPVPSREGADPIKNPHQSKSLLLILRKRTLRAAL